MPCPYTSLSAADIGISAKLRWIQATSRRKRRQTLSCDRDYTTNLGCINVRTTNLSMSMHPKRLARFRVHERQNYQSINVYAP